MEYYESGMVTPHTENYAIFGYIFGGFSYYGKFCAIFTQPKFKNMIKQNNKSRELEIHGGIYMA